MTEMYGSCSDEDLNKWERMPQNARVLVSYEFGAWLFRRDKNKKARANTDVLDKIRAEIEQAFCKVENDYDCGRNFGLYMATQIIDKYKEV